MNPNQHQQQKHQQNQPPQGQPQQPKAAEWAPSERTIFLLQSDDLFEKRARGHIERTFPRPLRARVTTVLNTTRLRPDNEIVIAYMDPDADIKEVDGKLRARRPARREQGKVIEAAELPEVLLSAPVRVDDIWLEDPGDDEGPMGTGGVQLRNLYNSRTGKEHPGLITRLTEACFGQTARGRDRAVVRVAHRDDLHEITVRAS